MYNFTPFAVKDLILKFKAVKRGESIFLTSSVSFAVPLVLNKTIFFCFLSVIISAGTLSTVPKMVFAVAFVQIAYYQQNMSLTQLYFGQNRQLKDEY